MSSSNSSNDSQDDSDEDMDMNEPQKDKSNLVHDDDDDDEDEDDDDNNNNNEEEDDIENEDSDEENPAIVVEEAMESFEPDQPDHNTTATTTTTRNHNNNNNNNNNNSTVTTAPPIMSKSWSIESIYGPIYTGGKVTYLELPNAPHNTDTTMKSTKQHKHIILVSQVMGDVCFINLQNHQRMTSIQESDHHRNGTTPTTNHIIDDNDTALNNKLDRNAITAYAIVPQNKVISPTTRTETSTGSTAIPTITDTNNTNSTSQLLCWNYTVMTCTQNNTLRLYTIQVHGVITPSPSSHHHTDETTTTTTTNDTNLHVQVQLVYTNTYSGHTLPVTDIQFHEISTFFVATASVDSTVRVWDVRNVSQPYLTHLFRPVNHVVSSSSSSPQPQPQPDRNTIQSVTCIRWIPIVHELILAIGRDDGSITIHNLRDSLSRSSVPSSTTQTTNQWTKKMSQKKNTVLSPHEQPTSSIIVLRDHISPVTGMEWDTTHQLFITSGRDAVIHVWKYHCPNDPMITTTSTQKTSSLVKTGSKNRTNSELMKQNNENITSNVYTYTRVSTLPIYEQVEGLVLIHFDTSSPGSNRMMTMMTDPDDDSSNNVNVTTTIATAGTKGQIRFWNIRSRIIESSDSNTTSGNSSPSIQKKYDIVPCHKIMSKGQGFFGESRGGYTSLQSVLVSTTSDTSFDSKSNTDDHCSPKYQHKQLLFVTDAEQNITFYSLLQEGDNNNKLVRPPHSRQQLCSLHTDRTVVGYNDEILDLKIIPNREPHLMSPERMVVVTNSTQIRVYDTHTLACTTVYDEYHTATILGIDVSPCGRYIVTCSKDRSIRLWSTALHNTQCIAVGMGHTDAVGSVALSRKMNLYDISGKAAMNGAGAYCVSVSVDRTVKRWNLPGTMELDATSKSVRSDDNDQNHNNNNNSDNSSILQLTPFSSAHGHEKDINIVAIAPNDSIVATGSQDKTVKLFKASNLAHLATLKGHRRGVWDVCFSPYDRIIATSSGDKSIKLWSLNDYSCVRTFQGHVSSVLRIRFLSGGLQLVSSGADGLVKLWTVRTNETEATMDAHTDRVWALDITKDGKRMISGGADSQIVIWKDTTREMEQAKMAVEEEAILVDQQLANYLRRKEYGDALKISLERDKPHHALKILNAMIEIDVQKGQNGLVSIQNYIKGWNNEQILRMLRYCREWNTRARNSHVALLTVKAIVSTIPIHKLASISGVPEIVAGIIPYLERHYERIDRLHASSYLFDFALSSMGVIDASDTDAIDDYKKWEANSKLMMPPKKVDGRIDVGGNVIVGAPRLVPQSTMHFSDSDDQGNDSDEIITIGESDDSDFE